MKDRISQVLVCIFAISGVLTFASCDSDDPEPVFEDPVLTITGSAEVTLKPSADITVNLTISAEGGVSSIVVNRNGGFLEEIDISDASITTFEYTGQSVPADAIEGDEIAYEFIAINTQGTRSSPVDYDVSVAVYDLVDNSVVGDVYMVTIPENGLVPVGATVSFAAGRSYYISNTLFFQDGSNLSIEEGVTIYINALDTVLHQVELQNGAGLTIEGTFSAPVVMTSSQVMTGDAPASNDWQGFRLVNVSNSNIQYLRIEYADDAFRLVGCDDSNDISYVSVFRCKDNGFYFTDGNVNAKYLAATEVGDNCFRLGEEYSGNLQFLIAYHADEGQEAIYLREQSNATIANVTIVGPGKEKKADGLENAGIRFRSSVGGKVYNSVITALPDWGVRAQEVLPIDINGASVLAFSHVYDNDERDASDGNIFFDESSFSNSEDAIEGLTVNSIAPSNEASSSFDPIDLGSFFSTAAFKGAIRDGGNDWTAGWVKNPDGSIR